MKNEAKEADARSHSRFNLVMEENGRLKKRVAQAMTEIEKKDATISS
jgi:hypothetical protein